MYYRLAIDERAKFGHKPVGWDSWGALQASRYVRKLQSRRSLLAWKVFGRRLDGFTNDSHPSESAPGKGDLVHNGQPIDMPKNRARQDVDFVGSEMPPDAAVAGTYAGSNGALIKVAALTDSDRRTLVRWIDLGCPIDLDFDPARPEERGYGWQLDDNRPVLTVTTPTAGANREITRLLVGMHDYGTGLDSNSFEVLADFAVNGVAAGKKLAPQFQSLTQGVWQLKLDQPIKSLTRGKLVFLVKDKQGNITRIERMVSVP